jgi:hypothetical protein
MYVGFDRCFKFVVGTGSGPASLIGGPSGRDQPFIVTEVHTPLGFVVVTKINEKRVSAWDPQGRCTFRDQARPV